MYVLDAQLPVLTNNCLTGSVKFREQIQKYNNALSFTSLGANIDDSVAGQLGIYVFRISGQLTHRIGSLIPLRGERTAFAQLFIYGGGDVEEANQRVKRSGCDLDPGIMYIFQRFMDRYNPYVRVFRSAAAICNSTVPRTLRIRTVTAPGMDHRRYNRPTCNEVAAIIDGDGQVGA